MVHGGDHHPVTTLHVGPAPRGGHEIDRLRGAARENDGFAGPRVHEAGDGGAPGFVRFGGLNGQRVGAAMHVRIVEVVVVLNRVEHLAGLLARRGIVQVDQALAVLFSGENREVGANAYGIEHQSLADSVVTGSPLFSSAARSACHGRLAHFTRAGNALTPAKAANFPGAFGPPVSIAWKARNSSFASAVVLP